MLGSLLAVPYTPLTLTILALLGSLNALEVRRYVSIKLQPQRCSVEEGDLLKGVLLRRVLPMLFQSSQLTNLVGSTESPLGFE